VDPALKHDRLGLPSARGDDDDRGWRNGVAERNGGEGFGTGEPQGLGALPQAAWSLIYI
jgi:hypothetical protein